MSSPYRHVPEASTSGGTCNLAPTNIAHRFGLRCPRPDTHPKTPHREEHAASLKHICSLDRDVLAPTRTRSLHIRRSMQPRYSSSLRSRCPRPDTHLKPPHQETYLIASAEDPDTQKPRTQPRNIFARSTETSSLRHAPEASTSGGTRSLAKNIAHRFGRGVLTPTRTRRLYIGRKLLCPHSLASVKRTPLRQADRQDLSVRPQQNREQIRCAE